LHHARCTSRIGFQLSPVSVLRSVVARRLPIMALNDGFLELGLRRRGASTLKRARQVTL